MKLLFIGHTFPYPPHDGGRIRRYHMLRALASQHEVTFAGLKKDGEDTQAIQNLGHYCSRVVNLGRRVMWDRVHPKNGSSDFCARGLGRTLSSPLPELLRDAEEEVLRALRQLITTIPFDACHIDGLGMLRYAPALTGMRRRSFFSLDLPNIESVKAKRQRQVLPTKRFVSEWRLMEQLDWFKLLYWERRLLKRFNVCTVCSEHDERLLSKRGVARKTLVVPNGVDTSYFNSDRTDELEGRIIFSGHMSYEPNVDGIQYFCTQMFPHIKRTIPIASLWIVGKTPVPAVQKVHNGKDVIVTGTVNDVRPYVRESAILAVPLRVGGGTRLKILEAMAMGKAIVSTSIGCEGLAVTNGENILISDDPRDFARNCINLLQNSALRRRLGNAARKLVCERYEWEQIRAEFANSYGAEYFRTSGSKTGDAIASGTMQPPSDRY